MSFATDERARLSESSETDLVEQLGIRARLRRKAHAQGRAPAAAALCEAIARRQLMLKAKLPRVRLRARSLVDERHVRVEP